MPFLRRYNTLTITGTTAIRIPVIKRSVVDFAVGADWSPAAGDVKILIDGTGAANVTNLPTAIAGANTGAVWEFVLTAAELTCKQCEVIISDAATKAIEDQCFIVETFGHASAMYQADLSLPNLPANVTQWLGTAASTPTVAGVPNVNAKTWNDLTTVELPLVPTTAGRKLDVSTGGEAGVDWANVGSPTTTVDLSGTTIKTTQKVDVDTIKTQSVTAAAGVTFPSSIASPTNITAGTITTTTNLTNAPTVGDLTAAMKASVTTAATAATPIAASVTGAVGSVTGNVGGNVAGSVGSVTADVEITQAGADKVWGTASRTLSSFGTLVADVATAVWGAATRLLTAGTNIVLAKGAGLTGLNDLSAAQVNTEADTAIADAALATAANLATAKTAIDAIKLQTDLLPSDPADESLVIAATNAIMTRLGVPVGADVTADITAVLTSVGLRLLTSGYTAPPTAAAIADAVYDEDGGKLRAHLPSVLKVIIGVGSTTTSIVLNSTTGIDGAAPSSVDDFYSGCVLVFTSGALAGQRTSCSDYVGATKVLTVVSLTSAPAAAVTAILV